MIILSKKLKQKAKKLKIENKIQEGNIIYSDLNVPEKAFFSKRFRITGKPDYIVKKDGYYIPVEIKTGIHQKAQNNHIFQLMAYCLLLEENYNCFVPYGILVYNDSLKSYKISYDPKMRFKLESLIKEMKKSLKSDKINRNHYEIKKCIKCSLRKYCNQKLG